MPHGKSCFQGFRSSRLVVVTASLLAGLSFANQSIAAAQGGVTSPPKLGKGQVTVQRTTKITQPDDVQNENLPSTPGRTP